MSTLGGTPFRISEFQYNFAMAILLKKSESPYEIAKRISEEHGLLPSKPNGGSK